MDVTRVISQLEKFKLIDSLPPEHHVHSRENEYRNRLVNFPPVYHPQQDRRGRTTLKDIRNVGANILISHGDVKDFPSRNEVPLENIERRVLEEGIDVLAWYRSFHWKPQYRWGIYILDKGIYYLAQKVFSKAQQTSLYERPYDLLDLLQQSFRLLFLHEFFHFLTDIAASTLEIGNPSPTLLYVNYVKNVYLKSRHPNEPLEEALANAFAYEKFSGKKVCKQLRNFMENQPHGYSAFKEYLGWKSRLGRRELGTYIRDGKRTGWNSAPLELIFDTRRQEVFFGDVPLYIVETITDARFMVRYITKIPRNAIIETPRFLKELNRLPNEIKRKYERKKRELEFNLNSRGLNFEKLKGCDTVFTVYRNPGGC